MSNVNISSITFFTHQSLVEVLILVWEVTELSWRTVAVDETGSKGRQKTCKNVRIVQVKELLYVMYCILALIMFYKAHDALYVVLTILSRN